MTLNTAVLAPTPSASVRTQTMVKIGVLFLLPLACIWLPESLGKFTGVMGLQAITAQTPAFLVSAAGWLLLVVVPLIAYVVAAT